MDDERALRELNERITSAENDGDKDCLASMLAPKLAFQRADKEHTVDDRDVFLKKLKSGGRRENLRIGPIEMYGKNRAIVQCLVKDGDRQFHNLRLFVRREDGWKLLGWANEEEKKASASSAT